MKKMSRNSKRYKFRFETFLFRVSQDAFRVLYWSILKPEVVKLPDIVRSEVQGLNTVLMISQVHIVDST